jgi:hypothetical protein
MTHLYHPQEKVWFTPDRFESSARPGLYVVVQPLPAGDRGFQYRVKSELDGHERMVVEQQLLPAAAPA